MKHCISVVSHTQILRFSSVKGLLFASLYIFLSDPTQHPPRILELTEFVNRFHLLLFLIGFSQLPEASMSEVD